MLTILVLICASIVAYQGHRHQQTADKKFNQIIALGIETKEQIKKGKNDLAESHRPFLIEVANGIEFSFSKLFFKLPIKNYGDRPAEHVKITLRSDRLPINVVLTPGEEIIPQGMTYNFKYFIANKNNVAKDLIRELRNDLQKRRNFLVITMSGSYSYGENKYTIPEKKFILNRPIPPKQ